MNEPSKIASARRARLLSELDDEFRYDVLLNESDRGAVIVASAFVEEALEHLLRQVLTTLSPKSTESGFSGSLGSIVGNAQCAARTEMCFTLGFLTTEQFEAVKDLRLLRNRFAHRKPDGHRPVLNLPEMAKLTKAFCKPGVCDIRFIGLLPDDVDFDSEILPTGMPRIAFAVAVWSLLLSLRSATDWWHSDTELVSPLRAIPEYDGPTWRERRLHAVRWGRRTSPCSRKARRAAAKRQARWTYWRSR